MWVAISEGVCFKRLRKPHTISRTVTRLNEPWILFAQLSIDNLISLACLPWIVLEQIAQNDIRIETDHRRKRSVAPASTAVFISLTEIGRFSLGTLPLNLDVRTFGKMATVPSGCRKNLNRSPGLRFKYSRTDLGIVA